MIVLKATQDKVLTVLQSVAGILERRHSLPILANCMLRRNSSTSSGILELATPLLPSRSKQSLSVKSLHHRWCTSALRSYGEIRRRRKRVEVNFWRRAGASPPVQCRQLGVRNKQPLVRSIG
jgi:hypothetical protein